MVRGREEDENVAARKRPEIPAIGSGRRSDLVIICMYVACSAIVLHLGYSMGFIYLRSEVENDDDVDEKVAFSMPY